MNISKKTMLISLLTILVSASFIVCTANHAGGAEPTEEEVIAWGVEGVSLFQCAIFAEKAQDQEARALFFKRGYDRIIRFYEYIRSGREISPKIDSKSPLILKLCLASPSPDFSTGMVWSEMVSDSYSRFNFGDYIGDEDGLKHHAQNLLWNKNCHILLKQLQ